MSSRKAGFITGGCDHGKERFALSTARGFTLVEMLVTITLVGILSGIFYTMFDTTFFNYLDLQKQAMNLTQLSTQSARISDVLRGATSVESADDNDLTVYAYFYPADMYVSKVHYYIIGPAGKKQLAADITPMTANPPLGSPDTTRLKTYTLIDSLSQPAGSKLFTYTNSAGTVLTAPVSDLSAIRSIQISLRGDINGTYDQTIQLSVSLRNRKTNL